MKKKPKNVDLNKGNIFEQNHIGQNKMFDVDGGPIPPTQTLTGEITAICFYDLSWPDTELLFFCFKIVIA